MAETGRSRPAPGTTGGPRTVPERAGRLRPRPVRSDQAMRRGGSARISKPPAVSVAAVAASNRSRGGSPPAKDRRARNASAKRYKNKSIGYLGMPHSQSQEPSAEQTPTS